MSLQKKPAVFGIVGWKNSGKTTLVTRLIHWMTTQGIRVSSIKHAHCQFDIDKPNSDSFRHREAGAEQVILASPYRWALLSELGDQPEPSLDELIVQLKTVDLVLVEGYKSEHHKKLLTVRHENRSDPFPPEGSSILAIASDQPLSPSDYPCLGPRFHLDDVDAIGRFILTECNLPPAI